MTIALALDSFFPDTKAGTEIYVLNLAKGLQQSGFDVYVVAASTFIEQNITNYKYEGIDVYRFKVPKSETTQKLNGIGKPSGIETFNMLLDLLKPDFLHIHSFSRALNSFHLQLTHQKGINTVFTSHLSGLFCIKGDFLYLDNYQCNGKTNRYKCLKCFIFSKTKNITLSTIGGLTLDILNFATPLRYLKPSVNIINNKKKELKRLNKNADAIISLAKWYDDVYKINGFSNTVVVKQGIDTKIFKKENFLEKENQKLKISFIGRNVYSKGLHLLVDVFKRINFENYYLRIIALPGNIKDYNDENCENIRNLKNCEYHESLSHSEINKILEDTDLLCLPSISGEMAPLVILEAYAHKVPVLGSSFPAIAEMIEDGKTGIIFENNHINDLEEKLRYILDNPQKIRDMKNNIKLVNSFDRVIEEHLKIYKSLV